MKDIPIEVEEIEMLMVSGKHSSRLKFSERCLFGQ